MSKYATTQTRHTVPRLPLSGSLDLTYRCNNHCRHCWLWLPINAPEKQQELTFDEIRDIAGQARAMGCREWAFSGGEPMLRPDFAEIFETLTRRATRYNLNTNGTLITPQIAQLMRREGRKMVAVYGATAEVHDHVTRNPGSFEATMRGFAYLKEAGARFEVQLIPMRDNYHQWDQMQALAESLSPHWRVGAAWLYLSAGGDPARNREIAEQRLSPRDVVALDQPDLSYEEWAAEGREAEEGHGYSHRAGDDRLFAVCIAGRRGFHVDPYGGMSFCSFIKDPALRYDLRQGSFQEAWDLFIPSLADQVRGSDEYQEHCGSCDVRADCRWCPVYAYLEHGRFSAPVDYLCAVAREARQFKDDWVENHRRYYECAGITFRVECDWPVTDATFHPTFNLFRVARPEAPRSVPHGDGSGGDWISMRHYEGFPDLDQDLGAEVARVRDWRLHKRGDAWIYLRASDDVAEGIERLAIFSRDHTRARVFGDHLDSPLRWHSFRSDHMLLTMAALAQVLADRGGCLMHASGGIMDGQGLLFVGHSDAGKTTIRSMLQGQAGVEVLGDDRNVIYGRPGGAHHDTGGYRIQGIWNSISVGDVSAASAPLRAILFLEQAPDNRLVRLDDRREALKRLLACLVKPLATAEWWDKSLIAVQDIACAVPCYTLRFDLSGGVVQVLRDLCQEEST